MKDRLSPYFDHVYTFTVDDLQFKPKSPLSFARHRAPPIDNPHQPSSGPADPGNNFTPAPCYSSTSSTLSFSHRPSNTAIEMLLW
jgi:hypothetical protein